MTNVKIEEKIKEKIKKPFQVKLHEDEKLPFCSLKLKTKTGRKKDISLHGFLLGMEVAFQLRKILKYHNLVIITGSVGSGKSSIAKLLGAVNAELEGVDFNLDNISWKTMSFIDKTNQENNFGTPQVWDESIQGATGRSMAMSTEGVKLKEAIVTKRFKRHTYYLLVDEINEYAWKLIKMANAWIHIETKMMQRGYGKVYTSPRKIQFLYNAFKHYGLTWSSTMVRGITPECYFKFSDFSDVFMCEKEYDKKKLEETQVDDNNGNILTDIQIRAIFMYGELKSYDKVANKLNTPSSTIRNWITKYRKVILPPSEQIT